MSKRRLSEEAERVNPVQPVHVWRSPPGSAVDIIVVAQLETYFVMHEQAMRALPAETGGFLLGTVGFDSWIGCWHVQIEEAIPLEPAEQNPTYFSFTWREVDQVRNYREAEGKALVGWYHTHPDLGIFLSQTDLKKTHRVLFSEPFQLALVYDPVRSRAGYFFWEGPQVIDASEAEWREFSIAVEGDVIGSLEYDGEEAPEEPPKEPEVYGFFPGIERSGPPADRDFQAEVDPGATPPLGTRALSREYEDRLDYPTSPDGSESGSESSPDEQERPLPAEMAPGETPDDAAGEADLDREELEEQDETRKLEVLADTAELNEPGEEDWSRSQDRERPPSEES